MTELRRKLTTFDLTMIAVGSTIGSGIFLTPSSIAAELQIPFWILAVWVVGGFMTLCGALTFSELAGMMPDAGGVYVYLTRGYGRLAGFLYGWAYFVVCNAGGIAALGIAFATYLSFFIPLGSLGVPLVAITGIILVTLLNIRGVKVGGVFSDIFTVLKLAAIGGLIVVGFTMGSGATTDFSASLGELPSGFAAKFAVAMIGVLWSCGGWQHATFTSAEATNPRKSVPRALAIGSAIIVTVYVLTMVAYMLLLTPEQIGASQRLATDAVSVAVGSIGASLVAIAIIISTFGTTGVYTLTAPRIYFAMARDGIFFRKVATIHPKYGTPAFAILFQSGWAILLILLWGTFESLVSYVVFTDYIFMALAAASIFLFRKRRPDAERPYRTLGYPFTPLVFILISGWVVIFTLIERPAQALAGLGFLALGIPVFLYWHRRSRSGEATA
jgi:APA family basic amino acid/polyamine antiporter